MTLDWIFAPCQQPSASHDQQARARQQQLTKPAGSLGQLEAAAISLAALQQRSQPSASRVPVLIFAADHGITAQGVSAFPSAVTCQMLANFAAGGAAISVLARSQQLPLSVIDVGSLGKTPIAGVICDKLRFGTANFSQQAAMDEEALTHALHVGQRQLLNACTGGADMVILGEMGIGNTSAASALACALAALPVTELTGAGTGLDTKGQQHKCAVIARALALHGAAIAAAPHPGLDALKRVGGLEIAALTGAMLAAAQQGVPVLVDGFIVTAAALAAVRINPQVRPWLLFSHCSDERGHAHLLAALDAKPLLHLGLRLGEGSGAALALPLLRLACELHNGMATFAEAAVSNRDDAS